MGQARFEVGQRVKVIRLLDSISSRKLIGLTGTIREIDDLPNGEFNYYVNNHYMHEGELMPMDSLLREGIIDKQPLDLDLDVIHPRGFMPK